MPPYPARMEKRDPFKYFKTSPEIIRLAVMMYVRFPLSLRNVEDLLHERGISRSCRFASVHFGGGKCRYQALLSTNVSNAALKSVLVWPSSLKKGNP